MRAVERADEAVQRESGRAMDHGLRPAPPRCQVLLVGDQPVVLAGLRAVLRLDRTMDVAGLVEGGASALQGAPAAGRVVVFATAAWTASCAEALAVLRGRHPGVRVVLLVGDAEPRRVRPFLSGGGHAVLKLSSDVATILETVRAAHAEGVPGDAGRGLSGREGLVLRRKVNGATNKAIAADLGLSVKTVETYYTRAMEKLGLQSRAQVLHYGLEQGWISR
jgi:DNA-binding NarL/FixJ family response regulator